MKQFILGTLTRVSKFAVSQAVDQSMQTFSLIRLAALAVICGVTLIAGLLALGIVVAIGSSIFGW